MSSFARKYPLVHAASRWLFLLEACSLGSGACSADRPPVTAKAGAVGKRTEPPKAATGVAPRTASDLRLLLSAASAESGIQLSVQNHGPEPVRLASELIVERRRTERDFEVVDGVRARLRADCSASAADPACRSLAVGGELTPPTVHFRTGDMQCGSATARLPAGEYRLVVRACDDIDRRWATPQVTQTPNER